MYHCLHAEAPFFAACEKAFLSVDLAVEEPSLVITHTCYHGIDILEFKRQYPVRMALDVDRGRHGRDVAGEGFHVDGQGGTSPAHPLRADAQVVDTLQKPFFHVGIKGVGVMRTQRTAQQRLLGQEGGIFEVAAYPNAYDNGWTGV